MDKRNEKKLDEEIENRISIMESADYVFPERFSKKDYIITAVVTGICLAAVIAGGFI